MVGPQNSTIYGMAIEHYTELGYNPAEGAILLSSMDNMSKRMTRVVKMRRPDGGRRVSENDAAEIIHALGDWLWKLEKRAPASAQAIYDGEVV